MIFGGGSKVKNSGGLWLPYHCGQCDGLAAFHAVENYKYGHVHGIRVAKCQGRYLLVCSRCDGAYVIQTKERFAIAREIARHIEAAGWADVDVMAEVINVARFVVGDSDLADALARAQARDYREQKAASPDETQLPAVREELYPDCAETMLRPESVASADFSSRMPDSSSRSASAAGRRVIANVGLFADTPDFSPTHPANGNASRSASSTPRGLVWAQQGGGPIDGRRDLDPWREIQAHLGLPGVDGHSMRHTTATLLVDLGSPKPSASRIGRETRHCRCTREPTFRPHAGTPRPRQHHRRGITLSPIELIHLQSPRSVGRHSRTPEVLRRAGGLHPMSLAAGPFRAVILMFFATTTGGFGACLAQQVCSFSASLQSSTGEGAS